MTKQTKTGALRELLREKVGRLEKPSPEERYRRTMKFLNANPPKQKIRKAEVDSLYDYLDVSQSHGD